ncbi:MAG: type IV secretion system protein [Coriobacteriia bacterium]|nr:type IV secretion system protein [Coriobacteriia bacterium]
MFSNYSVKKILPRLIIIAIAVNLSFYICAVFVDISNILGANLKDFVVNFGGTLPGQHDGFGEIVANIFGGAVGILAGIGLVLLIIMNLGTVVIGILLVFAALALREVLITVFIIISPIAFVMYLLPNTEKWFKKWLSEFSRMLFVFPMIAFVWGATQLITLILLADGLDVFKFVMVCLIQVVPALTILPIMKMGGQALGQLQGLAEKGMAKTPIKDIGNNLGQAAKSGGLNAAGRGLSSLSSKVRAPLNRNEIIMSGKNKGRKRYMKDGDGNIRDIANDNKVIPESAFSKGRGLRRFGGALIGGAGRGIGAAAGFGDGGLTEKTKLMADSAKGNTSSATGTENLKVKLGINKASLQADLDKHEYELRVRTTGKSGDRVIAHEAAKFGAEDKYKSGVTGSEYRTAQMAAAMNPSSVAAQARFSQVQDKIAQESQAILENSGAMSVRDANGNEQRVSVGNNASDVIAGLKGEGTGAALAGASADQQNIAIQAASKMLSTQLASASGEGEVEAIKGQIAELKTLSNSLHGANKNIGAAVNFDAMSRVADDRKAIIDARSRGVGGA